MNLKDIVHLRLVNQRIAGSGFEKPAEVVRWMGAMQAQDYPAALWGVGLRTKDAQIADVEQAIVNREIVRTWPMRGTLHFVPAEDIRWMLKLMTPRIISGMASRHRSLDLNEEIFAKSRKILVREMEGGKILTRGEMREVLERANISAEGQRGNHIFGVLAQEGLLCFGPHRGKPHSAKATRGKQPTFVLLDEWIAPSKDLEREEALAKLAKTYFSSHGPATLQDFVWWTGLKVSDARIGIALLGSKFSQETIEGNVYWMLKGLPDLPAGRQALSPTAYLLPAFEEYMLGYRDRSAALEAAHAQRVVPGGNGIFFPIIVIDGQIIGTWKKMVKKDSLFITLSPFRTLKISEKKALEIAAEQYGTFIGFPVHLLYQV